MVMDATRPSFNRDPEDPNPDAAKFLDMLAAADEPLWEGCKVHTKLSAVTQLLNCKSDFNISEHCYDRLMSIIKSMLPDGDKLPSSFFEAKKTVKELELGFPEWADEIWNVRLGLSFDGFTPFSNSSSPYSCWPVFVTPYNLPPGLCMKEQYLFLSLVIPEPNHPTYEAKVGGPVQYR
ncbi:Transposon, En/Spm-like protein [Quillaja saponaria]|uniref:Transposon, En/Spm-like protein n=1 Tax=Quillaja saponaria TaxID=32244 RepID=A0AAD7LAM8_QUISA|nr:Transposon, En/Spm-like protein [Quillaja saponaria]